MRLFIVLGAICALSKRTAAQTGECRSVADPAARLACYDKVAPANPAAARPAAAARPPVPTIDSAKYVDPISDEDAILNAKMKNICRGC